MEGRIESPNAHAVAIWMTTVGITPVNITESRVAGATPKWFTEIFGQVKLDEMELLLFTRQMGALVRAGVLNDPSITVESYRQLAAYARGKGIKLVVENHGNIARDPEALVGILKRAGIGSLPDFGNFPDDETRRRGLELLFPIAGDVAHAKVRDGMDFARCLRIADEAGFTGVFSVEASGRMDPYVEVQEMVDALVQHL